MYYKFNFDLKNLEQIALLIDKELGKKGIPSNILDDVKLCIDEAASNVILYARKTSKKNYFEIGISHQNRTIEISVVDYGEGYDFDSVEKPDLDSPLENRKIGGHGINFIKTLMDEVNYNRSAEKNILTMVKKY